MPEFIAGPLDEDIGVWKYSRRNWYKAGIDNYTAAPGQNPDRFLQLLNVQSPMTNNLLRRWGYRTFNPQEDDGSTASSDEHTPPLPPPGGSGSPVSLVQVGTGSDPTHSYSGQYDFGIDNNNSNLQNIVAGTTLVFLIQATPAVVTGITDDPFFGASGNTWTLIDKVEDGTMGIYAYKAENVLFADTTYYASALLSGAATFNLGLFNIANGLIDSYQLRNNATNTTLTTPTVITSGVDEVIIALAGVAGSFPTLSEGTGWTLDATDSESGVAGSAVATIHKAAATAGNYTPTVNSTGSANYGMAAIALKGSSVPGIKARRLYDYENQSSEIRTLIATASDAAGIDSLTNKVVYWDDSGTPQTIFTPSATAYHPRAVNSRDWEFFVDGVAADQRKVQITPTGAVIPFVLSAAANASSGNTDYTGVGLNVLGVGQTVIISGFGSSVNNGTFTIVNSSSTTLTVDNASGISETHAAIATVTGIENWGIAAPTTALTVGIPTGGGALSFALSAAGNASAGNTIYTGTSLDSLQTNIVVEIAGFVTHTSNNGTFTVISSTPTTVTVNNPSGVLESNPATLTTANSISPATSLNGWAGNAHLSLGANFNLSLISSVTAAYTNPNNAVDQNESTYAYAVGEAANQPRYGCVWTFSALATSITNATVNVLTEIPASGTDGYAVNAGFAGMYLSLDSGNTWTLICGTQNVSRTKQWDTLPIPDGQDYSKVQVMALMWPLNHYYHKVYEINIQGETVGNSPVILTQGRTYYYVYGNEITEHWSDLSPASVSTNPVNGGTIPLSNIVDSSDPQVTTKAILATADGNDPSILYLVSLLPNLTTTYQDNTSELSLLTNTTYLFTDNNGNEFGVTENDVPPNGQFPTKHASRLWMLNGPFAQYSKSVAELTTNTGFVAGRYEEAWPPEFQIDVSEVSEIGKGLLSDGQTLYVGTSRHIRRVTGNDPSNFSPAEVVFRDVGLMNQDVWSIVYIESTPIGAMWMTPDHRVILSDFNSYTDVGLTIQTTLNTINKDAEQNCWACFLNDGPYNYYMLAIPTGSNTDPDTLCVFDTRIKEWFIWQLADNVDIGLFYFNLFGVPRWFFMDDNGVPRLFDKTTFEDRSGDTTPVPIDHTIQTTWLDIGDGNARKAINEIELITTITGSLVSLDGATTSAEFASPISVLSGSSLIQDILGDWKVFPVGASAKSRYYRITITGASTSGSAVTDELLGGLILEIMPIHKY